jgi:hypothetical protein
LVTKATGRELILLDSTIESTAAPVETSFMEVDEVLPAAEPISTTAAVESSSTVAADEPLATAKPTQAKKEMNPEARRRILETLSALMPNAVRVEILD